MKDVRAPAFSILSLASSNIGHCCCCPPPISTPTQRQIKQRVINSVLDEQDRQRQGQHSNVFDHTLIAFRSIAHSQASRIRAHSIGLYHERDYDYERGCTQNNFIVGLSFVCNLRR